MKAFEIDELLAEHGASGQMYLEFLRESTMSLGIYVIPAGGTDPQSPHNEDEVYYVISGQGMIMVDGEDRAVTTGSTVFVGANVEHRFHSVTEDLKLLVFFAPPEGSV